MNTQFLVAHNPAHINAIKALKNHMGLSQKSNRTKHMYVTSISKFIRIHDRLPEECTTQEIETYLLKHKINGEYQYGTIKNLVYALKYYFKHIIGDDTYIQKIPCPKVKKYNVQVLSTSDINILMKACKNSKQRIIVHMLYETGMRLDELANLRLGNIDFYFKSITIMNSKNNKTRAIKFGATLEKSIRKYLNDFPTLFSGMHLTQRNQLFMPLSKSAIFSSLKRLAKITDIKKIVSPHIIRHSFAVHYLNFGGSLFQLQRILGHSNMTTTFGYLQYAIIDEAKNVSVLDAICNGNIDNDINV